MKVGLFTRIFAQMESGKLMAPLVTTPHCATAIIGLQQTVTCQTYYVYAIAFTTWNIWNGMKPRVYWNRSLRRKDEVASLPI